jgi:hypothetical protein
MNGVSINTLKDVQTSPFVFLEGLGREEEQN